MSNNAFPNDINTSIIMPISKNDLDCSALVEIVDALQQLDNRMKDILLPLFEQEEEKPLAAAVYIQLLSPLLDRTQAVHSILAGLIDCINNLKEINNRPPNPQNTLG